MVDKEVTNLVPLGNEIVHQTSGGEVPGSNPASPSMILMRCRIIFFSYNVDNKNLRFIKSPDVAGFTNTKLFCMLSTTILDCFLFLAVEVLASSGHDFCLIIVP